MALADERATVVVTMNSGTSRCSRSAAVTIVPSARSFAATTTGTSFQPVVSTSTFVFSLAPLRVTVMVVRPAFFPVTVTTPFATATVATDGSALWALSPGPAFVGHPGKSLRGSPDPTEVLPCVHDGSCFRRHASPLAFASELEHFSHGGDSSSRWRLTDISASAARMTLSSSAEGSWSCAARCSRVDERRASRTCSSQRETVEVSFW